MNETIDKISSQLLASIDKSQSKDKNSSANASAEQAAEPKASKQPAKSSGGASQSQDSPASSQPFGSNREMRGRLRWPD